LVKIDGRVKNVAGAIYLDFGNNKGATILPIALK
jgi:hypothetical protein